MRKGGVPVVSVLVVDDHEMVAEALVQALGAVDDLEVVGRAGSVAEALDRARALVPDVVVMDYRLPDGTGAEAAAALRAEHAETEIVMLTAYGDAGTLAEALEAGCSGFVKKEQEIGELVEAIRAATEGRIVVPPDMVDGLVQAMRPRGHTLGKDLTEREREVLGLLASGSSTEGIAAELVISEHTVRNHIRNALSKLQVHSRLEAVAVAARLGIVHLSR